MLVVLMETTHLGSRGFAIYEAMSFSVKLMMNTFKMISIFVA
ncbi:hypothetical protein Gohar_004645 [Gossypium harknessii]|uniref:Uncharacterized protein n=2 Tax=Gossypium TaxID=3633 RepID=A0A7J9JIF4_9ROSI|nr:hypothetical protein [Gossypium harknessii]MBA0834196.1 hypothetical protein [Gossypium armourianum]